MDNCRLSGCPNCGYAELISIDCPFDGHQELLTSKFGAVNIQYFLCLDCGNRLWTFDPTNNLDEIGFINTKSVTPP